MFFTVDGIVRDFKLVQLWKAAELIVFRPLGKTKSVNELQPLNAYSPIEVSFPAVPKVTVVKALQL